MYACLFNYENTQFYNNAVEQPHYFSFGYGFLFNMDRDIYIEICEHIEKNWIIPSKQSNRQFALDHDVDESIIRKILSGKRYKIEVETLRLICESRGLSLSDFFRKLNS